MVLFQLRAALRAVVTTDHVASLLDHGAGGAGGAVRGRVFINLYTDVLIQGDPEELV